MKVVFVFENTQVGFDTIAEMLDSLPKKRNHRNRKKAHTQE